MAWKLFDDFTDEHLTPDRSHRLTLALDGHEIDAWDVGTLDFDELRAQLGEHLLSVFVAPTPAAGPRRTTPASSGETDEQPLAEWEIELAERVTRSCRVCGCTDADCSACIEETGHPCHWVDADLCSRCHDTVPAGEPAGNDIQADQPEPEPQASAPAPVDESAGDEPDVVHVGEGDRGRASDSTVRAWCAHHGLPCSLTGAIKRWVRAAYERAEGGRPDEQAWADARDVGAGARRVNGYTLSADPKPGTVAAPAVVAVGDGTEAPYADAVDPARHDEPAVAAPPREPDAQTRAEELLEQNWTPKRVAEEVGLSLPEVRDLYRELRSGGGA